MQPLGPAAGSLASGSPEEPAAETPPPPAADGALPHEGRNFWLLTLYQVILRTGWIFKTESVIMPAVMDQLTDQPWMRGCLPLLNRLGQSIPPATLSNAIHHQPLKKRPFAATTALMAAAFGGLTLLFVLPPPKHLAAWLFLACYAFFFATLGVNNLVLNLIQGKLIRVRRRGRLLMISNLVGSATAIGAAFVILPWWLTETHVDAASVFGFSTALFVASSVIAWLLIEPADVRREEDRRPWYVAFSDAGNILRTDAAFRRFAFVAAMFGASMVLFPHYQAIGHDALHLDRTHLVTWLIVQNIGTAVFSTIAGPLADRRGNRLVVQILMFGILATPLAAVALMHVGPRGAGWFHVVFGMVGLTPVVIKTLNNYTLEMCPPEDHPRYVATLNLCLASPIAASPLVGWLIGKFSFEVAFLAVAAVVGLGWLVSFWLVEPRERMHD